MLIQIVLILEESVARLALKVRNLIVVSELSVSVEDL